MLSKKHIFVIALTAAILLFSTAFIRKQRIDNEANTTKIVRNYGSTLQASKVDYPKARFEFCNERMPINQPENYKKFNKEVRQFLAYPNGLRQLFRRADHYLPTIEKRLERCGLPSDLKYIPMIESRFLNDSSGRGAKGFWQFMPVTAVQYGLEVNDSTDERLDANKSTRAACNYLSEMHRTLKSWTLCAAAYNVGLGKVDRKLHHANKLFPSYYNMEWNQETSVYVYRLLAIKHIYENRDRYKL
jgi:membrane-bound lytic murein transglycosylase D